MMEQAIADYAVMIQHLRQQYKFTKVVVFGGRWVGVLHWCALSLKYFGMHVYKMLYIKIGNFILL